MKDGMNVEQGDIVLIPFPYSNLITIKRRPVLIISNDRHNNPNRDIICCSITSSKKFFYKGFLVDNKDLKSGNLDYSSIIIPSKIFTILQNKIIKRLGKLNTNKLKEVIKSLSYFTEVEEI